MKYSISMLLFAAVVGCTESTAPSAAPSGDLAPSYAKGGGSVGTTGCTSCLVNDLYTFTDGSVTKAGSHVTTDSQLGVTDVASSPVAVSSPSGEKFIGRFANTQTEALLVLPNGYSKYSLTFDLYTIGSWDGKGKQAQSGVFLANILSLRARCSAGVTKDVFSSTFSNQTTVQQDYPANLSLGQVGGNKAATGSLSQDNLRFREDPTSNTPAFRSFGDVTYRLSFAGDNPCGAGQPVTFVWSTSAPNQQSNYDESWGLDNITIKAGT
jgi:hypothetical protein